MNIEKIINELSESLNDSIRALRAIADSEKILKQAYEGRFLFELIQNARDANKEAGIENGKVKILLNQEALIILNTGAPFSEKGIKSISTIGDSPKDGNKYIGHKGIGFKSVLEISEKPEIETEFGTIFFDREKTYKKLIQNGKKISLEKTPLFFFPHYSIKKLQEKNYTTKIILPLKNDKSITSKLKIAFDEIDIEQLVLLGNLSEIILINHTEEIKYTINPVNQSNTLRIEKRINGKIENTSFFKLFSKKVEIDSETKEMLDDDEKELFKNNDELEIKVLIKTNINNRFIPIDRAKLYLYYPLKIKSGFPFLIHSNFIVNPERTQLSNSILNQFLLKHIGQFISNELLIALKKSYRNKLLSVINFERIDEIETLHITAIEHLKNKEFVYDKATNSFYKPDQIIIANEKNYKIFESKTFLGKRIILLENKNKEWLIQNFESSVLNNSLLLSQIESECRTQRDKNNFTFFENLYIYISQNKLEVEKKKIFLTTTKKLISQNETVFYGGAKEEILKDLPDSIRNKIYFIHSKVKIKNFQDSFESNAIKVFSLRDFVRKLLSIYTNTNDINWDILKTLISIDYEKNRVVKEELNQKVKFPIHNSDEWISGKEIIYLNTELLRKMYPNGKFINEELINKELNTTIDLIKFYDYCGIWNKPGIIIKKTILKYNDSRNHGLSKISNLSSYPFSIFNDRYLDKPDKIDEDFTKIIINNIDQYIAYINDSSLGRFEYLSNNASYKKSINDKTIVNYSSFTHWLKETKWISIKNSFYKPNQIISISTIDYSRQHNKQLLDFLPILPIDWINSINFYKELEIKHFDNYDLSNYKDILNYIYLDYREDLPENFKSFYNRILSKLSDLYDYDLSNSSKINWEELNKTYFLAFNEFADSFVWEKAENIYHIDNISLFRQLPLDIQKQLQPTFTNRDKNRFGRIATKIGRTTSTSIKHSLVQQKVSFEKKIADYCIFLPETLALLEFHIERSLKDEEVSSIKNTNFLFQESVNVSYRVTDSHKEFSTSIPYYIQDNQVYINKNSDLSVKQTVFNDLFSNILERDLKRFDLLIEDLLSARDKNLFLLRYEISEDRVYEINSLLNDYTLSKEQEFWLNILRMKDSFDFSREIIDDEILIKKIITENNLNEEEEISAKNLLSDIDYYKINSQANIDSIDSLFSLLNINLVNFNKSFSNGINFEQIHIYNLKKLFNKNENTFNSFVYSNLISKDSEKKQNFQSIIDEYIDLSNNIEISSEVIKLNYYNHFISQLNGRFEKYFDFTYSKLLNTDIIEYIERYRSENLKFEKHYKSQNIDFSKISENPKLRSLLYFDYKLLKPFENVFIAVKEEDNPDANSDDSLDKDIPLILAKTKPTVSKNSDMKAKRKNNGRRQDGSKSGQSKQENGFLAERMVFSRLHKDGYKSLKWVSKNASKVERDFIGFNPEGDDKLGYDIEYLDADDNKIFIEVKSRSNNDYSFPISANEIEFSINNSKYFKVIFVSNLKTNPIILDLGFMFDFDINEDFNKNSKFTSLINDYLIEFEV